MTHSFPTLRSSVLRRTEELLGKLRQLIDRATGYIPNTNQFRNADNLMGELKYGSGLINEHAAITKDKMSEVRCRLLLVSQSFAHFDELFAEHRSEEHTSELQSLMRISYAVFCLK